MNGILLTAIEIATCVRRIFECQDTLRYATHRILGLCCSAVRSRATVGWNHNTQRFVTRIGLNSDSAHQKLHGQSFLLGVEQDT